MRFFRNLRRYVVRITSFGFGFSLALGNFFLFICNLWCIEVRLDVPFSILVRIFPL